MTDLNAIYNPISLGLIMRKCCQFPILYPNWEKLIKLKFFLGIATVVLYCMKLKIGKGNRQSSILVHASNAYNIQYIWYITWHCCHLSPIAIINQILPFSTPPYTQMHSEMMRLRFHTDKIKSSDYISLSFFYDIMLIWIWQGECSRPLEN